MELCINTWSTEPRKLPEDAETNRIALSSRYIIWLSNPSLLKPSTLHFGLGGSPPYWIQRVNGEKHVVYLKSEYRVNWRRIPTSGVTGGSANNYTIRYKRKKFLQHINSPPWPQQGEVSIYGHIPLSKSGTSTDILFNINGSHLRV